VSAEVKSRSDERGRLQRDRILQAAQQCFIRDGFHAASMASIAATADMSAGLIYRYFESKSAIILAIIERQLVERRANIAALAGEPDLAHRVKELFVAWRDADPSVINAALFLEMSAEATRDPRIAEALMHSDRVSRDDFIAWMRQRAAEQGATPGERDLQVRALALLAFIEGLAIRAVREPDFDESVVAETVDRIVPPLLDFSATR
jgi:AcrR family transcriptional regulator